VLNFSAVAPLLARTDLLATLPMVVMHEALERYGLRALPPPFAIPPMPHRFVWSGRLGNDAAIRWLRSLITACFAEVLAECGRTMIAARRPARPSAKRSRPPGRRTRGTASADASASAVSLLRDRGTRGAGSDAEMVLRRASRELRPRSCATQPNVVASQASTIVRLVRCDATAAFGTEQRRRGGCGRVL